MAGSNWHRVYRMAFASVYPQYIRKAEAKGRSQEEVDEIICWLTGYSTQELQAHLHGGTDFLTFFAEAPAMNTASSEIKVVICGDRV